ncbi:MAG: hypothetical protein OXC57_02060 [Rhodobacteraceae bacterium]|nr:hypothetical protein [Paracoccaceae bacterium]
MGKGRAGPFHHPAIHHWRALHHGHRIVPGRAPGVGKLPVEPCAAHREAGCFSGIGGTGYATTRKKMCGYGRILGVKNLSGNYCRETIYYLVIP